MQYQQTAAYSLPVLKKLLGMVKQIHDITIHSLLLMDQRRTADQGRRGGRTSVTTATGTMCSNIPVKMIEVCLRVGTSSPF